MNNTTGIPTMDPYIYGVLGVHVGILFFIILFLPMGFLFVSKWKTMVFNKLLLYICLLLICLNQVVFQSFGIAFTVGLVTAEQGWIWRLIHAFESSGMMISITLCMDSQAIIAKIIYNIYFNKEQSWMRNNNQKNQILGRFYKISSISFVVVLNVLLLVFIVAVFTLFMIKYAETDITTLISDQTETVISVLGLFMSLGMLYFSILNIISVIALVRKLLPSNPKYPTSKERKTACQKLTALSIGQLLTAILNIISNIMQMLKVILPPPEIFFISSTIHKVAIGILCLLVTFAFGPLDNISFELKKKEPETDTTIVKIHKETSQSTPVSPNSIASEELPIIL